IATEPGITNAIKFLRTGATAKRIVLWVTTDNDAPEPGWLKNQLGDNDTVFACEVRGVGAGRWTQKNPPNYVARSHYLLGRTVDSGRVWDLVATARGLRARHGN